MNELERNFSDKVDNFWINKPVSTHHVCPNVSLFRLIGSVIGNVEQKKILELGFAHGSDLLECERRGAQVFGLDLNKNYISSVSQFTEAKLQLFRAGTDTIPFGVHFDLIYSIDTIYYLTDSELEQLFRQFCLNLMPQGHIIVQFIETDLKCEESKISENSDLDFLDNYKPHRIHAEKNSPIRHLKSNEVAAIAMRCGLQLTGSKRQLSSYNLNESEIRVEKFLVFTHCSEQKNT